ncbi:hypothetical protein [Rhodanobacter sp. DHG33]|nr:hypothetical protein [Rhodanobacter sp. DHG33]MBD8899143.1 hypothetical protein [Rhodanobacter sp. DHG33]
MDNATRRAAMLAADKLLAAAGYDLAGLSLKARAKKKGAAPSMTPHAL